MEDYNAVGMETFIPPAPVVQTTLRGAAMDRGSSDVMDEVSAAATLGLDTSHFRARQQPL